MRQNQVASSESNSIKQLSRADHPPCSAANGTPTVGALFSRWFYGRQWHAALVVVPCWLASVICGGTGHWVIYAALIVLPIWWSEGPFRKRYDRQKRERWDEIINQGSPSAPAGTRQFLASASSVLSNRPGLFACFPWMRVDDKQKYE